ncbi:MAG: DUF2029 domain-containing protein [Deltaproteobacteria bacterium]|nr:DUF2029 domain-containing protein [Deltaproteobacteria bacterium]
MESIESATKAAGGSTAARVLSYCAAPLTGILFFIPYTAWTGKEGAFQDFFTYYYSGLAWSRGVDPFVFAQIKELAAPEELLFPFLYSPVMLPLCSLFSRLTLPQAAYWYTVGAILTQMVAITLVVKFFFNARVKPLLFVTLLLFAFCTPNPPALIGLHSGNFAVYEAAFIWIALTLLLSGRRKAFLAVICTVSLAKLTPILLAPLVLAEGRDRRTWVELCTALALFALVWLSPLAWDPALFKSYIEAMGVFTAWERGLINPSSYSIALELRTLFSLPEWGPAVIYATYVVLILGFSFITASRARIVCEKKKVIFLAVLCYCLVLPRFKDYSYMLLFPVVYDLSRRHIELIAICLFGSLFLYNSPFALEAAADHLQLLPLLFQYSAFIALFCCWLYFVSEMREESTPLRPV